MISMNLIARDRVLFMITAIIRGCGFFPCFCRQPFYFNCRPRLGIIFMCRPWWLDGYQGLIPLLLRANVFGLTPRYETHPRHYCPGCRYTRIKNLRWDWRRDYGWSPSGPIICLISYPKRIFFHRYVCRIYPSRSGWQRIRKRKFWNVWSGTTTRNRRNERWDLFGVSFG